VCCRPDIVVLAFDAYRCAADHGFTLARIQCPSPLLLRQTTDRVEDGSNTDFQRPGSFLDMFTVIEAISKKLSQNSHNL
jgi:hypothetical protein